MQLVNPLFGAYFATFPRTLIPYDTSWVMIPHPVDGPLTTGVIFFVHFPPDTVTVSAEIGRVIAHFVDHTTCASTYVSPYRLWFHMDPGSFPLWGYQFYSPMVGMVETLLYEYDPSMVVACIVVLILRI